MATWIASAGTLRCTPVQSVLWQLHRRREQFVNRTRSPARRVGGRFAPADAAPILLHLEAATTPPTCKRIYWNDGTVRGCPTNGMHAQRQASKQSCTGHARRATPGRKPRSHAQARAQALGKTHPESDQRRPTAPMTWLESRVTASTQGVRDRSARGPRPLLALRWTGAGHRRSRLSDVTRPDVIERIKRPSHGMSPTSRGPRLQPEPPLADRSLTPDGPRGPQARPEELQLPHRRCRLCAFGHPVRQPVTSVVGARQLRIQPPLWP